MLREKTIWKGHDPWLGIEILNIPDSSSRTELLKRLLFMGRGLKNFYKPNIFFGETVEGLFKKEIINGINFITNCSLNGLTIPKSSGCFLYPNDEFPIIIYNGYNDQHHSHKIIISNDIRSFLETKPNNHNYDLTILGKANKLLIKELVFCGIKRQQIVIPPIEISNRAIFIAHKD